MLKLFFLLIVPSVIAELWRKDFHKKEGSGKSVVNVLLFSYILFMIDTTGIILFFSGEYLDFLVFLQRKVQTIEDAFLLSLLEAIQILLASFLGLIVRIAECRGLERAFTRIAAIQKKIGWTMVGACLITAIVLFLIKDTVERQLVINEVCSRNDKVLQDADGEYSDYIEIYNPSAYNVMLKGFKISDNSELDNGSISDEVVIPAGGHCLFWVNSLEEGYGISAEGEDIYLVNSSGEIIDSVVVPELESNTVYARATDGNVEWKIEVPSPLAENNPLKEYLKQPVFSAESGFYDEAFFLEIEADEGQKIYYTLDGSIPDESSYLYSDMLLVENPSEKPNVYYDIQNVVRDWLSQPTSSESVDKAFIIRAIAVDDYGNKSDVAARTYFVDMDQYKDTYVLSLISDPEDLFGDNGIYVTGKEYDDWYLSGKEGIEPVANFLKKGKDYEINTSVALFYNDLLMEQEAGLRIQGASQRYNSLKRFSVFARKEYSGSRYFDYDLFGKEMHSFFMRPDFIDAMIQELVSDRKVGILQAVPVTVFLDGELWYESILREKYNEDYLSATYGVESKDVYLTEGVPEELYLYLEGRDLSRPSEYEQFCNIVDIQSYIDYLAANIYMCNMDSSESRNCRMWRTQTNSGQGYSDGKWRWLMYDTDSVEWNRIGYYQAVRHDIDSFSQDKEYAGVAYNQETVYKALRTNGDFCKQFVLTFMDLANVNFSLDVVKQELAKWGRDISWNDGFFENRFNSIVPALAREFELTGSLEEITLKVNQEDAGIVTINTVTPKLTDGSWIGKYYTDYPVTITAIANENYEFVGWNNGTQIINEAQISVQLKVGGCTLEAVFEKKEK